MINKIMSKIYQLRNPFWLADFYVFSEIEVDLSLYDKGTVTAYPYIKVNPKNKIEQIGADIRSVFQGTAVGTAVDEIIKNSPIANKAHRSAYETIDMEYWDNIVASFVLHSKDNQVNLVVGRRAGTGKSFFLKKVFDEQGRLRTNSYWVYKEESLTPPFVGTVLELSNSKYDPSLKYILKDYKHDTVGDNLNDLYIKLKIKKMLEQESLEQ